MVNAPEGLNQIFFRRLDIYIEREKERGACFRKIQKKSEPTLPFALKCISGRSKNNPKLLLHLYVMTDNLSVLTGAIEFLPFDDSLANDIPSTLFKLQSTSWVKGQICFFGFETAKPVKRKPEAITYNIRGLGACREDLWPLIFKLGKHSVPQTPPAVLEGPQLRRPRSRWSLIRVSGYVEANLAASADDFHAASSQLLAATIHYFTLFMSRLLGWRHNDLRAWKRDFLASG